LCGQNTTNGLVNDHTYTTDLQNLHTQQIQQPLQLYHPLNHQQQQYQQQLHQQQLHQQQLHQQQLQEQLHQKQLQQHQIHQPLHQQQYFDQCLDEVMNAMFKNE